MARKLRYVQVIKLRYLISLLSVSGIMGDGCNECSMAVWMDILQTNCTKRET